MRHVNPRKSACSLQKFKLFRNNDFTSIFVFSTGYSIYFRKQIIRLQSIAIL